MNEIRQSYSHALKQLTFNSKPVINMLTMLAGDNAHAPDIIVSCIEERIRTVPPPQRLPCLYLIDSIMKNVGGQYIRLFGVNIVNTFMKVFEPGDANVRRAALHVRSTWNALFSAQLLADLDRLVGRVQGLPVAHQGAMSAPIHRHTAKPTVQAPLTVARQPPASVAAPAQPVPTADRMIRDYHAASDALSKAMRDYAHGKMSLAERQKVYDYILRVHEDLKVLSSRIRHPSYPLPPDLPLKPADFEQQQQQHQGRLAAPVGSPARGSPVIRDVPVAQPPASVATAVTHLPAPPAGSSVTDPRLVGRPAAAVASTGAAAPAFDTASFMQQLADSSGKKVPPKMTLQSDALNTFVPEFVQALYDNTDLQCTTCGVRFPAGAKQDLADHYDWHFRQAQNKGTPQPRQWYLPREDWIKLTGQEDIEQRSVSHVFETSQDGDAAVEGEARQLTEENCVADGTDVCKLCGDNFDSFFDEDEEEWMYRGARQTANGTFHVRCIEAAAAGNTGASEPSSPAFERKDASVLSRVNANSDGGSPTQLTGGSSTKRKAETDPTRSESNGKEVPSTDTVKRIKTES